MKSFEINKRSPKLSVLTVSKSTPFKSSIAKSSFTRSSNHISSTFIKEKSDKKVLFNGHDESSSSDSELSKYE